jgi:hypothetical protein
MSRCSSHDPTGLDDGHGDHGVIALLPSAMACMRAQRTQPPIGSQRGGRGPAPEPPRNRPACSPACSRESKFVRLPQREDLRGAMMNAGTRGGPSRKPTPCTQGTRCSRTSPRQPNAQSVRCEVSRAGAEEQRRFRLIPL